MLDPLTSLGLATNIVQLVDFGARVIKTGHDLAKGGGIAEHEHLAALAESSAALCADLQQQTGISDADLVDRQRESCLNNTDSSTPAGNAIADEEDIAILAKRTCDVAEDLALMLKGLKIEGRTINKDASTPVRAGSKRKRDVAATLVKAIWKEGDVQRMQKQLLELQDGLSLSLGVMNSQKSTTILNKLAEITDNQRKQRDEQLAEVEQKWRPILEAADRLQHAAESGDQLGRVLCESIMKLFQQSKTVTACGRLQSSLEFKEMDQREEIISEAHIRTFKWIFDNQDIGFSEWASTKDGNFWITGKPGSGKSTLTKYITHHSATCDLLTTWAKGRELVTAYHYLWNAGTDLQRSRIGLLRTLLYHVVRLCPDLAASLVPKRFRLSSGTQKSDWTLQELSRTLELITKRNDTNTCFCFFIDGLDEATGDPSDLVELLNCLSDCPSIKLCISSRPWSVFNAAYDGRMDGQLEVQSLTRHDIQNYVSDRMNNHSWFRQLRSQDDEAYSNLVKEITNKAQGVFLWVNLVVRSLLRGLDNEDTISELSLRLREYPDSLDGYYQRMFDRIENIYRCQSARILLIALKSDDGSLATFTPHCLSREIEDPDYALKALLDGASEHSQSVTNDVFGCWASSLQEPCGGRILVAPHDMPPPRRVLASKRYLDARCADLLGIVNGSIHFIHRTARDFLSSPRVLSSLEQRAGERFDAYLSMVRLSLWRMKTLSAEKGAVDPDAIVQDMLKYVRHVQRENLNSFCLLIQDVHENQRTRGMHFSRLPLSQASTFAIAAFVHRWKAGGRCDLMPTWTNFYVDESLA